MANENKNEFIMIWRIEDFSICDYDIFGAGIVSSQCTAENLENSSFDFVIGSTIKNNGPEDYLNCYLHYEDGAKDGYIPIECTMELIDPFGETLKSETFLKSGVESDSCYHTFDWEIITLEEILKKMINWTERTLIVRCHILREVQARQPKIECQLRTKVGVDRCSCLWNVKMPNTSNWSEGRVFSFSERTSIHVSLSAPEDDILINIKKDIKARVFVTCKMSLLDSRGNEVCSQTADYFLKKNIDAVWKFPTFFTKTILEENKYPLLNNNRFPLICNFSLRNGRNINEVSYHPLINVPYTVDAVSSLQSDLRDMFSSKKHADVKLQVDGEIFPAHKGLLAARSPVISAMLDHNMLESRTNTVEIEDLDVKTMKSFLHFMYAGTVEDMDYENASKLLMAAEKYQVLSLKDKCASFLMSILSEENVCEIIALSDMFGHEILKTNSIYYIKSHARNILRSPQWLIWSENNAKLATEIFSMLSTNIETGE